MQSKQWHKMKNSFLESQDALYLYAWHSDRNVSIVNKRTLILCSSVHMQLCIYIWFCIPALAIKGRRYDYLCLVSSADTIYFAFSARSYILACLPLRETNLERFYEFFWSVKMHLLKCRCAWTSVLDSLFFLFRSKWQKIRFVRSTVYSLTEQ